MHISTENNIIYKKWMICNVLHRDFDNFKRFDAFFAKKISFKLDKNNISQSCQKDNDSLYFHNNSS